jgi:hypothetical protein
VAGESYYSRRAARDPGWRRQAIDGARARYDAAKDGPETAAHLSVTALEFEQAPN